MKACWREGTKSCRLDWLLCAGHSICACGFLTTKHKTDWPLLPKDSSLGCSDTMLGLSPSIYPLPIHPSILLFNDFSWRSLCVPETIVRIIATDKKDKVCEYLLDRCRSVFLPNMSQAELLFFNLSFISFSRKDMPNKKWHEEGRKYSQVGPKRSYSLSTICLWCSFTHLLGFLPSNFFMASQPRWQLLFTTTILFHILDGR